MRKKILIVDDSPEIVRMYAAFLESVGYEAVGFTDGGAAICRYRANPAEFDAVVLDYDMPGLDGEQVFFVLRSINPSLRAVFASSGMPADRQKKLFEFGAAFLQKPFPLSRLARAIEDAVEAQP